MRVHTLLTYSLILSPFLLPTMAIAEHDQEHNANLQVKSIEASNGLTLQSALTLALEANPEIFAAIREREAIEGVVIQAGTRPNPSVSAMLEDTRSSTRQTTLQFNQPIELGGKRDSRIKAATLGYDLTGSELDLKKMQIMASVNLAFQEVLIAQERVKLLQSSLALAQHAKDAAGKRVIAGQISPVEETKSKVAESAVKIELNQANSLLDNARNRLTALWGNFSPEFEFALGDVDKAATLPPLNDLINAVQNSPAIQRANLEINRRKALVEVENTKRTPDVTISVGARRNEELGLNQAVLGLSVPIPLFDRNQGNIQQALSRAEKAKDELSITDIQLRSTVTQAYRRWSSNHNAIESLRADILPGAQSAYDAATRGFELGKFNFLDVLDAQRTLFQAKTQYLNALLETYQAVADIERIVGDIASYPKAKP
jgi:cobalt-zinc-cadmium efflux system outer membrane protein